jgi:hypothetical protein
MEPLDDRAKETLITVGKQGIKIAQAIRIGVSPNALVKALEGGLTGDVSLALIDFAVQAEIETNERTKQI